MLVTAAMIYLKFRNNIIFIHYRTILFCTVNSKYGSHWIWCLLNQMHEFVISLIYKH